MIDVVDVGERLDRHVIFDVAAVGSLDRNRPFAGFRAQQDDLARLLVMHHQRVRICDYVHSRRRAGADVVDYVTLTGIQGESHCRAVVGEQQAGPKHKHADSCN